MKRSIEWAAGLFEGEGWISPLGKRGIQVALASPDKDVITAFHKTVKLGRVYGPYRRAAMKPHHKSSYEWRVNKKKECIEILESFIPFFLKRRSLRARAAVRFLKLT